MNPETQTSSNLLTAIDYHPEKIQRKIVFEHGTVKGMVVALSKGLSMKPHTSPTDVFVTILEGEALITVEDKPHLLKPFDTLHFAAGQLHALEAITDFKMLLVK